MESRGFALGLRRLLLKPREEDIVLQVHVVLKISGELRQPCIEPPPGPAGVMRRREAVRQRRECLDAFPMRLMIVAHGCDRVHCISQVSVSCQVEVRN